MVPTIRSAFPLYIVTYEEIGFLAIPWHDMELFNVFVLKYVAISEVMVFTFPVFGRGPVKSIENVFKISHTGIIAVVLYVGPGIAF